MWRKMQKKNLKDQFNKLKKEINERALAGTNACALYVRCTQSGLKNTENMSAMITADVFQGHGDSSTGG